jgi:hypothetical protein
VEEHCHFMACLPFMLRLACVLEIPVSAASHDSFWLTCAVVAADCHSISGWVAALVTACLGLGFAAFCFA